MSDKTLFVSDEAVGAVVREMPIPESWAKMTIVIHAPVDVNPGFYRTDPPADEPHVVEDRK